jgi:hypothetical protein
MLTFDAGTCLDAAAVKLRVGARVAVLEKVSAGSDTFGLMRGGATLWCYYKIMLITLKVSWNPIGKRL